MNNVSMQVRNQSDFAMFKAGCGSDVCNIAFETEKTLCENVVCEFVGKRCENSLEKFVDCDEYLFLDCMQEPMCCPPFCCNHN